MEKLKEGIEKQKNEIKGVIDGYRKFTTGNCDENTDLIHELKILNEEKEDERKENALFRAVVSKASVIL